MSVKALPETRYARSGDLQIAYQVIGDGPLDLVFVSGFVFHIELIWSDPALSRFFRRLASFARVVLLDKRGQGLSDRPAEPPTLEQSMDDVRAVMDAAGIGRAALFGVSEGGPMCMLLAATHPDRVSALALYGTYARMLDDDGYRGVSQPALEWFIAMLEREWGGPAAIDVFAPSRARDPEFREWWGRFLRQGTSPRGARDLFELYRAIDVRPVLEAIAVPTLVMHRRDDIAIPPAAGRYIADHVAGARYAELQGADHLFAVGDWEAVLDEVEEFLTGQRGQREPDRVLATVMFTDIVGSTARAAEAGDRRWRELVDRHDEVVREELGRHRGRAIKTLGDGFLAIFDGPARAVRAAQTVTGRTRELGIEVRAGLHTGEIELLADDVAGMAVNIGARVAALAGPGEVLTSSTVKDLVVGSGIEFEERGEYRLKGVPGAWRLFAACT
jgi:class 3 adenylate cyclase